MTMTSGTFPGSLRLTNRFVGEHSLLKFRRNKPRSKNPERVCDAPKVRETPSHRLRQPRPGSRGRICICTPDYVHLVKNGGIGTAFHHLALVLVGRGFEVTIVYASEIHHMSRSERAMAIASIEAEGCEIEFLFDQDAKKFDGALYPNDIYTRGSYLAYKTLASRDFGTIIFADWRGVAYYSVHAKRQGLAFARTNLWIQGHSSSLWHGLHNHADHYDQLDIRSFHFERRAIELCDKFVPASAYLADWNLDHGFRLPADTEVLPLVINEDLLPRPPAEPTTNVERPAITEIVFFGRLEQRKGLQIFLQAIQRLVSRHADLVAEKGLTFAFVGKITDVHGMSSIDYIEQHLGNLPVRYSVLASLTSSEAIRYLAKRPALAVIPSLADNSPMTIHECIYAKIPFIASDAGGIAEIIHPDDHDVLFRPMPNKLADAILAAIARPVKSVRARINQENDNIPRWLGLLEARPVAAAPQPMPTQLVSVCITHYERPHFLAQTLKGLEDQTCRTFEVLIVDNGSTSTEAVEFLAGLEQQYPMLTIRQFALPDLFPGAARNLAVREAKGEFVLVMDDDNYAHPRQIELFLKAAVTSGFDALTCVAVLFPEDISCPDFTSDFYCLYLPTGNGISINLFNNLYGDANGFFRKSALEAIGGYTEERSSWEDYELYSALELAGYKTAVVPEPLMYLRQTTGSVSRTGAMLGNYYRALRPALRHFPWSTFGDALLISLNDTLRSVSKSNFGAAAANGDNRALRDQHDPVVVNRLLIRRALSGDRIIHGLEQIRAILEASPQVDVLGWDLYLLASSCHRLDMWRVSHASDEVVAIAKSFELANREGDFGQLSQLLAKLDRGEPDFCYLRGLSKLLSGSPIEAFQTWVHMLDEADSAYLQRNPDLSGALDAGHFRKAYGHYLRHGAKEGRPFNFEPPVKAPFGALGAQPYDAYLADIELLYSLPIVEAIDHLSRLVLRLIATGSMIEMTDLAEHVLDLAESLYLDVNVDVRNAMTKGGWDRDGTTHWISLGKGEGRSHLIGSLPTYMASRGSVVPASEITAVALQRNSIRSSPLGEWLRISV